jgi:hypothetical protein
MVLYLMTKENSNGSVVGSFELEDYEVFIAANTLISESFGFMRRTYACHLH